MFFVFQKFPTPYNFFFNILVLLDLLFNASQKNDEDFQRTVIRLIRLTVENATKSSQITSDLVSFTTKSQCFYDTLNVDALKVFEILVEQLSVDFHADICLHILEVLPKIARFYSFTMDQDDKEAYYSAAFVSLNVIFPNFQNGEITDFGDNEEIVSKMLRTLWTSMEVEIKEKKLYSYRLNECSDMFYKLAASLIHIVSSSQVLVFSFTS